MLAHLPYLLHSTYTEELGPSWASSGSGTAGPGTPYEGSLSSWGANGVIAGSYNYVWLLQVTKLILSRQVQTRSGFLIPPSLDSRETLLRSDTHDWKLGWGQGKNVEKNKNKGGYARSHDQFVPEGMVFPGRVGHASKQANYLGQVELAWSFMLALKRVGCATYKKRTR